MGNRYYLVANNLRVCTCKWYYLVAINRRVCMGKWYYLVTINLRVCMGKWCYLVAINHTRHRSDHPKLNRARTELQFRSRDLALVLRTHTNL